MGKWMDARKRIEALAPDAVQRGNLTWWTRNTMSYDWRNRVQGERFSREWFDEIDRRLVFGARLFATSEAPFDQVIPFEKLSGREVLEIGCGMGLHTELLVRAGAKVTAIDISPTSVEATRTRLRLKNLQADVMQIDAQRLPFPDDRFDFIWSWGVIHHSAMTGRIVREIARCLRSDGECRVMVYNRDGMAARVSYLRDHIARLGFLRGTFDETLYRRSDGFSARFYVREHFEDLFRTFFDDVASNVCGQDADVVPLPRRVRMIVLRVLGETYARRAQARRGAFIVVRAASPSKSPVA
jgi:2-polyprenyl-3-methyl-5-hydroxy-6-metoxy-1,4-benzoquinol methylase